MGEPLTVASPFPYDPNQPIPELVTLMLEHIDRLPIAEQAEGWLSLIAFLIRVMPSTQVLSLRAEIGKLPIEVCWDSSLEVIDGHLALRELGIVDEDGEEDEAFYL